MKRGVRGDVRDSVIMGMYGGESGWCDFYWSCFEDKCEA